METTIPAARLKQLQIIVIALVFGATLMSFVMIFLGISNTDAPQQNDALMPLRLVHLVLSVFVIVLFRIIPPKILSGKIKLRTTGGEAVQFFQRYMSATIVQLALLEGITLFGAIIFFTAAIAGAVRTDATYYLHFLPLLFFIVQAKILYPTEEKFNELQRQYQG